MKACNRLLVLKVNVICCLPWSFLGIILNAENSGDEGWPGVDLYPTLTHCRHKTEILGKQVTFKMQFIFVFTLLLYNKQDNTKVKERAVFLRVSMSEKKKLKSKPMQPLSLEHI